MGLQTPIKIREFQRKLYIKAKNEPDYRFYQLYDKVYRRDILEHAYRLARHNGGGPGVDGVRFDDIESSGVAEWLTGLEKDLREKTYKPSAVRRVMIPKANGGERPLGIPTIRDRVAQTAVKLVIEPIFEADFEPNAYGYRPRRSACDAVAKVRETLKAGYTDVVDADLSRYFDTIPHQELMKSVARRIVDKWILKIIRMWLDTPIEERDDKGNTRMTGSKGMGTPQGGVISPLLANIYMRRYLYTWRIRGKGKEFSARIVNYADDFVILSRGHAAAALSWTREVLGKIGLTLNEGKTHICDARRESFDFLGYTFGMERRWGDGVRYMAAKPSKKSVKRLREKIGAILRPGNMDRLGVVAQELNRTLSGWNNYFSYGSTGKAYRAVNNYVLFGVRRFLVRRHKDPTRGSKHYTSGYIFGKLGIRRLGWKSRVEA